MTLTKFALTFVNKDGLRVLAHANNGRHFWTTKQEGFNWLKLMYKNTSLDTIKQVFGDKPKFKINQIVCYSSGDSTRTVFEN